MTLTRAAVATGPYTELRDFPLPAVGPDDGLLRVEAAAICGTDWEIYGRESRGRGLGPLILGHENVGRVVALGERAAERWGVGVGDRVAVQEFLPCGTCRLCRGGDYRLCVVGRARPAPARSSWSARPGTGTGWTRPSRSAPTTP
jgi:threonine dehydrogenase-like Zn-dependent dehydrogenase